MKLTLLGRASQSSTSYEIQGDDLSVNLMSFLRSKGHPIASACYGEGVCKKCCILVNKEEIISCQIHLNSLTMGANYLIEIEYL